MMNLTGNDHQFGQGGRREWTFRYRLVLLTKPFDAVQAFRQAQQFATPPFLQVPGQPPAVPALKALDVSFDGGPLLAFKVAADNQRLILRFWNVLDRPVVGSLRPPSGWQRAEICDALERPRKPVSADQEQVSFEAEPHEIVTLALSQNR